MKRLLPCALAFIIASAASSAAQHRGLSEAEESPVKVVVTNSIPVQTAKPAPLPAATPTPIIVGSRPSGPAARGSNDTAPGEATLGRTLSFGQIKSKIAEAKRELQTRPTPTAMMVNNVPGTETVRIAFHDWRTNSIDYISMSKDEFLSIASDKVKISERGRRITARTIRANGTNTPVSLTDDTGQQHLPLLVQYPVVREGRFIETAYYMSTHPGLGTPEVVAAGKYYVHNVIEIARDRLKAKGIAIQPKIADIAERLSTVEHVDHTRFRTEPHQTIFNDIFTLYALNEGQTYRYSVSSAGAGGMVQMIPSTYRMVRSRYAGVGLMPDFVEGMRNHVNAAQAMLLYMDMTWSDLAASPTVSNAMSDGVATQEQLMAAGYNSNPARLAGYISRGGDGWTSLIPRETRIYLQIYDSLERLVPMTPRTR